MPCIGLYVYIYRYIYIYIYQWLRSEIDHGVFYTSYCINISITTPVVSALNNYYAYRIYDRASWKSQRIFKPLLDPGGGFTRFQKWKWNGRYVTVSVSEVKRLQIYSGFMWHLTAIPQPTKASVWRSGIRYNSGYVTAVAVGQRQRLYRTLVSECLPGIISVSFTAEL